MSRSHDQMYSNSRQKRLIDYTLHRTASRNWTTHAVIYTLGRLTMNSTTQWGKIHRSAMLWGQQIKSFCHNLAIYHKGYKTR